MKVSDERHIRLSDMDKYIDEMISKNKQLEKESQELNDKISTVRKQTSEIENLRDLALEQKRAAELEMKSYTNAKQELNRYDIPISEDLPKFARTVNSIAQYGYNPKMVIREFEDIQYLSHKKGALEIANQELEKSVAKLVHHESLLRHSINLHSQNLPVYEKLANIGFGSAELRALLHKILNIASSNGINHWLAVRKFYDDIEGQYDTKLGLEAKVEDLKLEIQILKEEREKGLKRLKVQPFVGPIIMGLLQRGLTEDTILRFAETCLSLSNMTYSEEELKKCIMFILEKIMIAIKVEIISRMRQDMTRPSHFIT